MQNLSNVTDQNPESPASIEIPTSFKGFTYKIEGRPDYAFLTVQIPPTQTLNVEASAMPTMHTH